MNETLSKTVKKVTQFLNQSSPEKAKLTSTVSSIPQDVIVNSDLNSNKGETEEIGDNQTDVSKRN